MCNLSPPCFRRRSLRQPHPASLRWRCRQLHPAHELEFAHVQKVLGNGSEMFNTAPVARGIFRCMTLEQRICNRYRPEPRGGAKVFLGRKRRPTDKGNGHHNQSTAVQQHYTHIAAGPAVAQFDKAAGRHRPARPDVPTVRSIITLIYICHNK